MSTIDDAAEVIGRFAEDAARALAAEGRPAPTLSEELRTLNIDQLDESTLDYLADRAEKIEQERDDARAEVERLTAERDREKTISKGWMEAHQKLAEHHAETLECAVQKDAESSDLPDPADVPYGEAWLVEYHGDDLPALRRLDHPGDWYLVRKNGTGGHVRGQDITLVSRLVPAPRQITTRGELNALPEGTVVRAKGELVCERYRHRSKGLVWISTGVDEDFPVDRPVLPATVLWTPEVPA